MLSVECFLSPFPCRIIRANPCNPCPLPPQYLNRKNFCGGTCGTRNGDATFVTSNHGPAALSAACNSPRFQFTSSCPPTRRDVNVSGASTLILNNATFVTAVSLNCQ